MSNTETLNALSASPGKTGGWSKHILGLLISAACLILIARKVDLSGLSLALSQFQWIFLIYGLFSLAIGYFFRVARWTLMLRAAKAPVKLATCTAPFLGSMALNNLLPLRLGDVVRAFVFPSAIGVDKATATSSLVMERLVDVLTVFACLMIGLVITKGTQLPTWLAQSVLTMVTLGSLALAMMFLFSGRLARWLTGLTPTDGKPYSTKEKLFKALANLLFGFEAMSRWRVLAALFAVSIIVWVCESGLFWCLLMGFHLETSLPPAMMVMAIVTFSTLVPLSPGYIGPFHLAAFTAISLLGGAAGQAASFAVLSHLSLWLPTTLAGVIAILFTPELFKAVIKKQTIKA